MGPGGALALGGLERPFHAELAGIGFDQHQPAVLLIAKDQVPIGVEHGRRTLARRLRLPANLARLKLQTDGPAVVLAIPAVKVIAHQHHAAVVILELAGAEIIHFLHVEAVAVSGQPQQGATRLVAGGDEHQVTPNHRRGDVGHPVGDAVVAPEESTRLGFDADRAAADDGQVLANPLDLGHHDGGVAGAVLAPFADVGHGTLPDHVAALLVQRDHGGVGAAGRADQPRAVHDGRLAELPDRHHLAAEVVGQAAVPQATAGGRVQADQVAAGAQGIDPPAVDRGRAAGPVRVGRSHLGGPQLLLRLEVQGNHELRLLAGPVLAVAHGEKASSGDRHGRVALAQSMNLPQQRRPALGPLLEEARLGANPVVVRPPELRPVGHGGRADARQDGPGQKSSQQQSRHAARAVPRCRSLHGILFRLTNQ